MTVFLLEDPELPLIQLSALIRTGSIYDPADQVGLAKITAAVLRNGGTDDQSPQEINEALESMAAQLEFGMNRESGIGALCRCRKRIFPRRWRSFPAFSSAPPSAASSSTWPRNRRSKPSAAPTTTRKRSRTGSFAGSFTAGNPRGWAPTLESVAEDSAVRPARLPPEILPARPYLSGSFRRFQKRGDDRRAGKGVSGLGTARLRDSLYSQPDPLRFPDRRPMCPKTSPRRPFSWAIFPSPWIIRTTFPSRWPISSWAAADSIPA